MVVVAVGLGNDDVLVSGRGFLPVDVVDDEAGEEEEEGAYGCLAPGLRR